VLPFSLQLPVPGWVRWALPRSTGGRGDSEKLHTARPAGLPSLFSAALDGLRQLCGCHSAAPFTSLLLPHFCPVLCLYLTKKTSESFEVNGWKGNSHLFPPEGPS
jgi:hypothetical protein